MSALCEVDWATGTTGGTGTQCGPTGGKGTLQLFFDSTSFTTTITVSTTTSKYMLMRSVKCLLG